METTNSIIIQENSTKCAELLFVAFAESGVVWLVNLFCVFSRFLSPKSWRIFMNRI